MRAPSLPATVRRQVRARAGRGCEYGVLADEDALFPHEADHSMATKHGGPSPLATLAFACCDGNRCKSSDMASRDAVSGALVSLLHPRLHQGQEHVRLAGGAIVPLTAIGRVTALLLKCHVLQRVEVRETLVRTGQYPRRVLGASHRGSATSRASSSSRNKRWVHALALSCQEA